VGLTYGRKALGIILTGMGRDGVEGLRALRGAGGRVIAQDEATSIVFGMPGATVAAGLADDVLPLDAIGPRLGDCACLRKRSAP
jgi:two-component system chemotaxis response regulator CheB